MIHVFRAFVIALMLCLVLPATASERLYWIDDGSTDTIQRSRLDGTGLTDAFSIPGSTEGLAIDGGNNKVYWTDNSTDEIKRADLDGSNLEVLVTGLGSALAIALDVPAGKMYWTDANTGKVQRANLNGTVVEDIHTGTSPRGIAVDSGAGKVYWADSGTGDVYRANLDGSALDTLHNSIDSPTGLAVDPDGGKVYWSETSVDRIYRADLDGSNLELLQSSLLTAIEHLAVDPDSEKLYWSDQSNDAIYRSNLDGSSRDTLVTGLDNPDAIALDLDYDKLYVNPYGTTSIPTIQAGLNLAEPGDEVRLLPGTYTEADLQLTWGADLVGHTGDPADVILSGTPGHSGIVVQSNSNDGRVATLTLAHGSKGISLFGGNALIEDCIVRDLQLGIAPPARDGIGIDISASGGTTYVRGTLIHSNPDAGIWTSKNSVIEGCTLVGNRTGISVLFADPVIRRCILANNTNTGIGCSGGSPIISCNNSYGNSTDYTCVPPAGNFSLDPRFCDPLTFDFGLQADSPCLPYQHPTSACESEGIGALGQGCAGVNEPAIAVITDVGNDQGRNVRIEFTASNRDGAVGNPVTSYDVFRRIDTLPSKPVPGPTHPLGVMLAGWDYVTSVPAHQEADYNVVAATLADSTITAGMYESTFLVRASTANSGVFYDSAPDSGYSVDNLAPGAPLALITAYEPTSVTLDWDDAPEGDFMVFRIYRDTAPGFAPSPGNLVQEVAGSDWTDFVADAFQYHYKISAVDFAGNESLFTTASEVTGVGDGFTGTARFALGANAPNPFRSGTRIAFSLAESGNASLEVFDVSGRLIRTLVQGTMDSGDHFIRWDGRDERGADVAAGVYLYRLAMGDERATRRMILLQ